MTEPFETSTRVDRTLGDPVVWDDPPPRLRSQLLATAAVERQRRDRIGGAAEPTAPSVAVQDGGVRRASRASSNPSDRGSAVARRRGLHRALAVAAVLVVGVVGAGFVMRASPPDDGVRLALTAPSAESDARGVAEIRPLPSGMEVTLRTDGLGPAASGDYYAAWLRGDSMIPIGSFHLRGGPDDEVVLWSAASLIDFPTLLVTRQRVGDPPTPTDDVVLIGAFTEP